MNKTKSIMTMTALATVIATTAGCYTERHAHARRVYEPAGAEREYYYRDGRYYAPRDDRNRQWYYRDSDGRYRHYDERHQWDNRNYRYP